MKESAQRADLRSSRAHSWIDIGVFEKSDIHIHVPAGAIPKDGPSAGVAMYVALVSLLTGRTARSDVGDDRGNFAAWPRASDRRVKEKALAAARAGHHDRAAAVAQQKGSRRRA